MRLRSAAGRPRRLAGRVGTFLGAALVAGLASVALAPAASAASNATGVVRAAPATASFERGVGSPGAVTKPTTPTSPQAPVSPTQSTPDDGTVAVNIKGVTDKPSTSVVVILAITLLSVAPALLLMMTSFTKIIVVLGLTRNALGLQGTPPNQVLVGLALFLSLFIMSPVLSKVNDAGIQPYLHGTSFSQSYEQGIKPLESFMLDHTRKEELALMSKAAGRDLPATRAAVPITTLIPAFVLSELKSAFIIGFVIFLPFLVIDIVVSASLMSMGMMMLPPVVISLPFKLLLFVLVDGWGMVVTSLVASYRGGGA
ncbi:MAG: flagellar type III secretion system pore protein FliP [Actinomycetales bacterium]